MVQYLALKTDKSRFRVNIDPLVRENEKVEFDAELYNDSYELVNQPDVRLTITDHEKKTYPFIMGRTSHAYHLDAGNFPPGEYTYIAKTDFGGKQFSKSGSFSVIELNVESLNLQADHNLLNKLATDHGGRMVYPREISQLVDMIKKRDDIRPVIFSQTNYEELISLFWLFLAIIILLSAEWFIRKRWGSY